LGGPALLLQIAKVISPCSTSGKMWIVLKTHIVCPQDLPGQIVHPPDAKRQCVPWQVTAGKSPRCATELLAAPSNKMGIVLWIHLKIGYIGPPLTKLTSTRWARDYKSKDLDCQKTKQQGELQKKRSWDHKVTYSTINKMGIVLKPLRDR
jgi:hypothetical protein